MLPRPISIVSPNCSRRTRRLTGSGCDHVECLNRASGLADGQPLSRAGLHDHHRNRVGDDVVKLSGDPGPLIADRQLRVGVAFGLELVGLLDQPLGNGLASSESEAGQVEGDGKHDVGGTSEPSSKAMI
jgi:hypothetical protein